MTSVRPLDLSKATVVLACAMSLAAVSGTAVETQTFSESGTTCPVSTVASEQDAEFVVEPGIIEYQRAEKKGRLSRKFQQLAQQWRDERGTTSSIDEMSMLIPYQNIIGMGADALPLILAQLRGEGDDPDQWFWALMSISEANDLNPPQIKAEDQGSFKRMSEIWLEWGESQGYAG